MEMYPPANVADGWYVQRRGHARRAGRNRDALLWFLEQAGGQKVVEMRGLEPPDPAMRTQCPLPVELHPHGSRKYTDDPLRPGVPVRGGAAPLCGGSDNHYYYESIYSASFRQR